jgi:hypothetical protein
MSPQLSILSRPLSKGGLHFFARNVAKGGFLDKYRALVLSLSKYFGLLGD